MHLNQRLRHGLIDIHFLAKAMITLWGLFTVQGLVGDPLLKTKFITRGANEAAMAGRVDLITF